VNKLLTLAALAVVSCAAPPAPALEDAKYAASLMVDIGASTKVGSMYIRDLTVGSGASADAGQLVTMRYTGWLIDGAQFDSNQAEGFQFRIGGGRVIGGWDLGVRGMLVGGTRQLIIPPSLGYGEEGTGGIPGNSILVFNVTMMSTP
jgi:FKBP-type peptidyl-prolyl cis-trans isomerase FkpA